MIVEEFWKNYADKPYELIRGEIVETALSDFQKGVVASEVIGVLGEFVDQRDLGEVVGWVGFQLGDDSLLGPDVAYICSKNVAAIMEREKFVPFAPDLAVEVVSAADAALIDRKVALYLAAGTQLVWALYPDTRTVAVHHVSGAMWEVAGNEALDGGDVLPGFSIPASALFPAL